YNFEIPVLFQTTFDLPDFNGHLRPFRNSGSGSIDAWPKEAGQKMLDTLKTTMGTTSYTFSQLTGGATISSTIGSSAKRQRRIMPTTGDGVFGPSAAAPVPAQKMPLRVVVMMRRCSLADEPMIELIGQAAAAHHDHDPQRYLRREHERAAHRAGVRGRTQ